ncbi:hypothetical protein ACVGWM_05625, partial [Enterobacter hormaechei]
HSGITMIVVTHEIHIARQIADRIVFIDGGKKLETAPPAQYFNQPSHQMTLIQISYPTRR